MIKIFLVDDHAMVREGLRLLLEVQSDLVVVGEAGDGREAVRLVHLRCPDVLILDVVMPRLNGLDAIAQVRSRCPSTQVVILTMHANEEYVRRALQAGALAFVLKEALGAEVIRAVRAAHRGQHYLSPEIARIGTFVSTARAISSPIEQLSEREREVLQLLVEGHTSAQMADLLALSPKTVETYRSRLMQKLGLSDLPSLVKFAIQHGLTSLD